MMNSYHASAYPKDGRFYIGILSSEGIYDLEYDQKSDHLFEISKSDYNMVDEWDDTCRKGVTFKVFRDDMKVLNGKVLGLNISKEMIDGSITKFPHYIESNRHGTKK